LKRKAATKSVAAKLSCDGEAEERFLKKTLTLFEDAQPFGNNENAKTNGFSWDLT